jgi:RNA polymerase sigma factor (sigma-70 family)
MDQNEQFLSTHWSLVLAAGERASPDAEQALAALCRTYWYPLFAFLRRKGHDFAEAEDLTQGFFTALLEKDFLKDVDRERGRFRSFLLAALKHYTAKQHRAARAQKRGGGLGLFSIDCSEAEHRYQQEPFHEVTPESLFDHHWATTVIERVLEALAADHAGKTALFAELKGYLDGSNPAPYREAAERFGMTEGALKVAVHRLRQRFGVLLRNEIARTVARPEEIEDELQALFKALRLEA